MGAQHVSWNVVHVAVAAGAADHGRMWGCRKERSARPGTLKNPDRLPTCVSHAPVSDRLLVSCFLIFALARLRCFPSPLASSRATTQNARLDCPTTFFNKTKNLRACDNHAKTTCLSLQIHLWWPQFNRKLLAGSDACCVLPDELSCSTVRRPSLQVGRKKGGAKTGKLQDQLCTAMVSATLIQIVQYRLRGVKLT